MPKLVPNENPALATELPALKTTSVAHPETWNPVHQMLLDSVTYLGSDANAKESALQSITMRLSEVESSSSVAIERAVKADWALRDNRIAHELWAPSFTLIDANPVAVIEAVAGDDSIDIADTSQIKRGEYYVLSVDIETAIEDEGVIGFVNATELVQCVAILSSNRIRVSKNLTRGFDGGELSRCSFDIEGASHANAKDGDIWLSKKINIGARASGGAVVVRRSLNSTKASLFYQDAETPLWQERNWSHRRQGGDIPAGFADYEYSLPMRGEGSLRLDVIDGDLTIRHIVAVSAPTGLGGFINPEMRPLAPAISSPEPEATGVTETPTLSIVEYLSPGGAPQQSIRFQLSLSEDFSSVLYDTGNLPAGLSFSMPENVIPAAAETWIRANVGDAAGLESDWCEPSKFTTMSTYAYVRAPVIVSPVNGATDVLETPRIVTDAFAVSGDGAEPNQIAAQYQIRELSGSWGAPLWDSGRDEGNLGHIDLLAGVLRAGTKAYAIRARKEDGVLGWSEWGAEVRITTKQMFANVIGIALAEAGKDGGVWHYVGEDGNAIAAPSASFFNSHPVWGGIQDVMIDGQVMVKIPKFHVKYGTVNIAPYSGALPARWVSDQPLPGFHIHPAFMKDGAEVAQVYIGKYQASMQGAKLASVSGVLPAVNRSQTQFIADANARNASGVSGFMLWSIHQWSSIQYLYLIENATMNSQTKTGQGRVSASSAANVDAADVAQATYRGIVGLWGNVYQWMDGMKAVSGTIHLWDSDGNKTYINTGRTRSAAVNTVIYPTTFMTETGSGYSFSDHFIGDTGPASNANATAPDYQYIGSGAEFVPFVGGAWSNAALAGLCHLSVYNAPSDSATSLGARLAKV